MKTVQLFIGLLIIGMFIAVIYLGAPNRNSSESGRSIPTFSTETVSLQLGKSEYKIPRNYFGTSPGVGCNARTATIDVLLPDFSPRTAETYKQFWKTGEGRRSIFMLLQEDRSWDMDGKEYIRRQVAAMVNKNGRTKSLKSVDGLTSYPPSNAESQGDLFISYKGNLPQSYLLCSKEHSNLRPNSSCDHHFPYKKMVVKINYPRLMLSKWNTLEAETKLMLDRFYVGPAISLKEPCHDTF